MYSALTAHLGMRPYEHEYKLMGMAPYGQPDFIGDGLAQAFRAARDTPGGGATINTLFERALASRLVGLALRQFFDSHVNRSGLIPLRGPAC